MLKELDAQADIFTSEQAKSASLRERVRMEDWLKQHRIAKRHGSRVMESSAAATQVF
jgi:hypothetical protein